MTGLSGYLPESKFRDYYQLGRITEADLSASLHHFADLDADAIVCSVDGRAISRYEVYRIALLFDLDPITENQLNWNIDELDALDALQKDVPDAIKKSLLSDGSSSNTERDEVRQIWSNILDKLGLDASVPHPENLLDLSQEQAQDWLEKITLDLLGGGVNQSLHELMRAEAEKSLSLLLAEVGERLTLG